MRTDAIEVTLSQNEIRQLCEQYHFPEKDNVKLEAAYQMMRPLLKVRAYSLAENVLGTLAAADYVPVLVTIGEGVDALQEVYLKRGAMSEAYRIECLSLAVLLKSYEEVAKKLQPVFGKKVSRLHFLGDDEYPFSLLHGIYTKIRQEGGQVEITYNEEYAMTPQKSVALILELAPLQESGQGAEEALLNKQQRKEKADALCHVHFSHICESCPNVTCEYRKVKKANYTYGYQRIFGKGGDAPC